MSAYVEELEKLSTQIRSIVEGAADEGRGMTEDESEIVEKAQVRSAQIESQLELLAGIEAREAKARDLASKVSTPSVRAGVHAGNGNDNAYLGEEHKFIADVLRAKFNGDNEAAKRLEASNMQVRSEIAARGGVVPSYGKLIPANVRAFTTSDLVPVPSYEKPVAVDREGRPFVNALTRRNVTSETVHVPTVDAGLSVGFQSAQNTAFGSVDLGTTDASYTVKTLGVYTDIPVQALDFASVDTADVIRELQRGYDITVDQEALRGTADDATHLLGVLNTPNINSVSGAGLTDFEDLYDAIGEAVADIQDDTYSNETPVVVMDRRYYGWFKRQLTDKFPALAAVGLDSALDYRIIADSNVSALGATPTHNIVVALPSRVWFYEANGGNLSVIDDVNTVAVNGQVRIVARNYVNYPGVQPRPGSAAKITGLAAV